MKKTILILVGILFLFVFIPESKAVTQNITSCGTYGFLYNDIDYVLTQDIIDSNVNGYYYVFCIRMMGGNNTLDCQGHTIDGRYIHSNTDYAGVALAGDVTIKNCIISDWSYGIDNNVGYGGFSEGWTLDNVTVFHSMYAGVNSAVGYSGYPVRGTIKNSNIYDNADSSGIHISGVGYYNNITIENTYVHENLYGIDFCADASGDMFIINSTIQDSTLSSLFLCVGNFSIFNNIFNDTSYLYTSTYHGSPAIKFNTSSQNGTNIIGGTTIGGNYWTNSTGNGYSDTCEDSDRDGICDNPYYVAGYQYDYLSLSNEYAPPTVTCPNMKNCSIYDMDTTTGMIQGNLCGMYNFLTCIISPLMIFLFLAVGGIIIISIFAMMQYILSRRE